MPALSLPPIIGHRCARAEAPENTLAGLRRAAALVRSAREDLGLPVFLNADHTHSLEKAREAAEAGVDG